jgi:hypothetical protein
MRKDASCILKGEWAWRKRAKSFTHGEGKMKKSAGAQGVDAKGRLLVNWNHASIHPCIHPVK